MRTINLVRVDDETWVNTGEGNIDYVCLDAPMGNDTGPRVMIRFKSGFGRLLPDGIQMGVVISRLMGKPVTDMGNQWWCEGDLMIGAQRNEHCRREKPHGPHGYDISEESHG